MTRILKFIFLVSIFVSCQNNRAKGPDKPDNLIPEEEMVEVIYDMSLISAAKGVNRKTMEIEGINPEQFVYDKHNIDSLQFALSNAYYTYDLKTYAQLYARVKVKLQEDKDRFNAILDTEKKAKDSLNKLKRNRKKDTIIDNLEKKKLNIDNAKSIDLLKKDD